MKKLLLALATTSLCFGWAYSQKTLPLDNLEAFSGGENNWSIAGDVMSPLSQENKIIKSPGTGVLVCEHENGKYGVKYDLITKFQHGDLDLEFDFMMSVGANSGVYLQGQYEIQLFDSWGTQRPKYSDVGGVYERWDDTQAKGEEGYEGYAPRVNVAKAPGLWQKMKISFQAAKFNDDGEKTHNAKILSINLNGVVIHENVELTGPTRGALKPSDLAKGPLRLQGDHGSVAFKNITIWNYDQPSAKLSNISYAANYDAYDPTVNPMELSPTHTGSLEKLTWEFLKQPNPYTVNIKGTLTAPTKGLYTFEQYASCSNALYIDGKEVLKNSYTNINQARKVSIELSKGEHEIRFYNAHFDSWMATALGLFVSGPGFRATPLHAESSLIGGKPTDPILIEADKNIVLRSFMDYDAFDSKKRIVHNVNVGHSSGSHYSYNTDKGSIFQVWRGDFLNATPMWNSRGDGSSRPLGAKLVFRDDLLFSKSSSIDWPRDTTESHFRPLGYKVNQASEPTFRYKIYGSTVEDEIRVVEGKELRRNLTISQNPGMFARLARGNKVTEVEKGLFAIDQKYYIQLNSDINILVRKRSSMEELVAPITEEQFSYSIIY